MRFFKTLSFVCLINIAAATYSHGAAPPWNDSNISSLSDLNDFLQMKREKEKEVADAQDTGEDCDYSNLSTICEHNTLPAKVMMSHGGPQDPNAPNVTNDTETGA